MIELNFNIAGIHIRFDMPNEYLPGKLGLLETFCVNPQSEPAHHFSVKLVDTVDPPVGTLLGSEPGIQNYGDKNMECRYAVNGNGDWRTAHMRTLHDGRFHEVQLRKDCGNWLGESMILQAMAMDHLLAQHGGVVLHASCVAHQGEAYLFTAPSGTGKSTQADLWVKYRDAEVINGDRICIRSVDNILYACGIPYAGSSGLSKNKILPLKAILCLEQASETTICVLQGYQAFRRIWEGISVNCANKKSVVAVSGVVESVLKNIPVFLLSCTPDESAIAAVEKILGSR